MTITGLRSGKKLVSDVAFFGRMLDKIRIHNEGRLPDDYNLGTGFDGSLCEFLGVSYDDVKQRTLHGGTDEEILKWCRAEGRNLTEQDLRLWNSYVLKQGWNDTSTETLEQVKADAGFEGREEIRTWVDFHDADEGRM